MKPATVPRDGTRPKKLFFGTEWSQAIRDHGPAQFDATLRAILYTLALYMDNTSGEARPSEATLARGAGCSRGTVSRRLGRALAEQGLGAWLERTTARDRYGHQHCAYRGRIPVEVRLAMASKPCEGASPGPVDDDARPCDSRTSSHVTEAHRNYGRGPRRQAAKDGEHWAMTLPDPTAYDE